MFKLLMFKRNEFRESDIKFYLSTQKTEIRQNIDSRVAY